MKILFLSSGRLNPSSRFRIQPFAVKLQAAGHQCAVSHSLPSMYDHWPWLGFRLSQRLKRVLRRIDLLRVRFAGYDAVVIERQLFNSPDGSIERRLHELNTTVVLDIDDAVFLHFPEKMREIATKVELVLAGNASLVEWGMQHNSNVVSMPTCIDTNEYRAQLQENRVVDVPVVGWMGTSSNMAHLAIVADALRRTSAQHRFRLRIVSNDAKPLSRVRLDGIETEFVRWSPESERRDLATFDVGLMPLVEDEWSRFKCGAKLLQYMATAVPSIASPVGVNREIIHHGKNGFLASTTDEWVACLKALLGDRDVRSRIGMKARETVVDRYSLQRHLPQWIEAVEAAVHRRAVTRCDNP